MRALLVLAVVGAAVPADVDWAAGRIGASGVGPADLRAPSPDIARVAAERAARRSARARIEAATRALRWAGGGTVGERAAADPELAKALTAALDGLVTDDLAIQSDGSVVVRLHLGLDALAGAPAAGEALVAVDARALAVMPAVGLALAADAARYTGPLRFVDRAPPGARVVAATAAAAGTITVRDATALAAARSPVYIVIRQP
jgi:hypothetical protein